MTEISVTFAYDNTRGVYEGRVNGGVRFYFSGHRDAPMPQALHNALTSLRHMTILSAESNRPVKEETLSLDEVLDKIKDFEARGGRVKRSRLAVKRQLSVLNIDDLEIEL